MEENLAYCGLICRTCQIYLATREPDEEKQYEMRANIAQEIEKHYGRETKPEDVDDCDGCRTDGGRLFCTDCQIRMCAIKKGIANCAYCRDYPCEALENLFTTDSGAKERLDAIRNDQNSG
ncbi:MAG: DUF3795 domain-containing protein [Sedimentisphaerales bacterium]|nr:DUF3795 domain-containing protein [Sedimentisphaerales bacterium]